MIERHNLRVVCILLSFSISYYIIFIYQRGTPPPKEIPREELSTSTKQDSIPSPPGIIVNLRGGTGNQLFMYAWAYALSKEKGWPIYVLSTIQSKRQFGPRSREFALDQFSIQSQSYQLISQEIFKEIPKDNLLSISDENFLNKSISIPPKLIVNSGYCQSPFYWQDFNKEEIKSIFKIPEDSPLIIQLKSYPLNSTIKLIEESESVAVHVRRGDMASSAAFSLPTSFHKNAVRKIVQLLKERGKDPTFFIFSDDISYSKELFSEFKQLRFVYISSLTTASIQDLYLMRKCKHIIFPNSTFSWWAAYFIDGIVITTSFNPNFFSIWKGEDKEFYKKLHGTMYHPKDWIVINPFTGNLVQTA